MPVIYNGKIYFGSNDCKFYCLDEAEGKKIWDFKTGFCWWIGGSSSPAVSDGRVYFGNSDKHLYCLDAENGKTQWSFKAPGRIISPPFFYENKIYFGSWGKRFFCLNGKSGNKIWDFKIDTFFGLIDGGYSVVDDCLYFASDWKIYCFDAENGRQLWDFDTFPGLSKNPVVMDKYIYLGGGKRIYCLER